ncbi:iron uptake porin [Nostoc spongiaeforme]|nr:iron uptake porin [Nostoc spongiaeforme]
MTLLLVSSMTVMANVTISYALPPIEASDIENFSEPNILEQVPTVSQFADVQPTDWAFVALRSLVEKYGIISGYPDGTYRGNRAMSRYEFVAGLNLALTQIHQLIAAGDTVSPEDLTLLQKLQTEFAAELTTLRSQVEQLEAQTTVLASQQFSTTTKLSTQVIIAGNAGGYTSDRIIAPRGAVITENQPNATIIYRVSLNFNTSFTGKDLLQVRLVTGSGSADDNTAGFLEPNLGSTLEFSIPGRNNQISLARLYYTFPLAQDLSLTLGPSITAPDFVDKNRYANLSFLDFSTQALVNNYVLFPRARGAGAFLEWNPGAGALHLRGVYLAGDANNTLPENAQLFGGGRPQDIRLFPVGGGGATGGLFGDPYQGIIELEYAPSQSWALRLQYGGGRIFGSDFAAFGVNFDWALSNRLGVFGRYGYSSYSNTTVGDIHPNYWMAGLAFPNLFVNRAIAGIAIGQPLIENAVGNATQTNFEAFYNFPLTERIRITPLIQVITNPANQDANGTIISGTMRMVLSF